MGTKPNDNEDIHQPQDAPNAPVPDGSDAPAPVNGRHLLQDYWTFWYQHYDREEKKQDVPRRAYDFYSAEGFWTFYALLKKPMELDAGCGLILLKHGIDPNCSAPENVHGGHWFLKLNEDTDEKINALWLDTLLLLIGNTLESGDDVRGAVFSRCNEGAEIEVWLADRGDKKAIMDVGFSLLDQLKLQGKHLAFHPHEHVPDRIATTTPPNLK